MPTEAERAAEHERQRAARCASRRQRLVALGGNPDARRALALAWQPVYLAQLEAGLPPEPLDPDGDEELCP